MPFLILLPESKTIEMKREEFEIEVCSNSVRSSLEADKAGANRIELCDNLYEGGTTPSIGTILQCKEQCSLSVFPIIRPRGGDFLYSNEELAVMIKDIEIARIHGADGFVIGCLKEDGQINYEMNARLIEAAKGLPVSFHRAFDMTKNPKESLEVLKQLGISRLLTSGQENKAKDGKKLIRSLVEQAGQHLIIMPGSGIDESNIVDIATYSKAKAFHLSLREPIESKMQFRRDGIYMGGLKDIPEYENKYTSSERVRNFIELLKQI